MFESSHHGRLFQFGGWYIADWFQQPTWLQAPAFTDLDALNTWLEQRCQTLWHEIRHPEYKDRTIAEVWQDEVVCLMSVPAPFDGYIEHSKRVSSTCLITFDNNRYSVPESFANSTLCALTANREVARMSCERLLCVGGHH